jgi:hypothetical protein
MRRTRDSCAHKLALGERSGLRNGYLEARSCHEARLESMHDIAGGNGTDRDEGAQRDILWISIAYVANCEPEVCSQSWEALAPAQCASWACARPRTRACAHTLWHSPVNTSVRPSQVAL